MPQVYPHHTRRQRRKASLKWIWHTVGIAVVLFVALNAALYVYYRNRTYPNTYVMSVKVGNRTQSGVAEVINKPGVTLIPEKVTLQHGDRTQTLAISELGISEDTSKLGGVNHTSNWFPLGELFTKHTFPAPVRVDDAVLRAKAESLKPIFHKEPTNASIALNDTAFTVADAQDGFTLDTSKLSSQLVAALRAGKQTANVPVQTLQPPVKTSDMQATAKKLNASLSTSLTYRFGNTARVPDAKTIASWYAKSGDDYAVSDVAVGNYLLQQGRQLSIQPGNVRDVMARTKTALASQTASEFTMTPYTSTKSVSYCLAVRGVNESAIPTLRSKAAQTLSDIRGWSLDGQVVFKEVSSGCDFTLWLSAAYMMPTFGGVCDSMWSCRIGNNVVINYDRWQNASPAWNKMGGTLDEYRDMVINHETGHWIGFGHDHCGGAGQPAPVMQQQSINLQGCTFSPWPSSSERSAARGKFGI